MLSETRKVSKQDTWTELFFFFIWRDKHSDPSRTWAESQQLRHWRRTDAANRQLGTNSHTTTTYCDLNADGCANPFILYFFLILPSHFRSSGYTNTFIITQSNQPTVTPTRLLAQNLKPAYPNQEGILPPLWDFFCFSDANAKKIKGLKQ